MEAGQYATLNKDVGFKKVVYSKKGTKVKIISISGNAVIYETEKGKRCGEEYIFKTEETYSRSSRFH